VKYPNLSHQIVVMLFLIKLWSMQLLNIWSTSRRFSFANAFQGLHFWIETYEKRRKLRFAIETRTHGSKTSCFSMGKDQKEWTIGHNFLRWFPIPVASNGHCERNKHVRRHYCRLPIRSSCCMSLWGLIKYKNWKIRTVY